METLNEFVQRLSDNVGCYSHLCKSGIVSLKKNDTRIRGKMGVFAWIRELKQKGIFEIATYKDLAEKAGVNINKLDYEEKQRMHWEKIGIAFKVEKNSEADNFKQVITVLRAILNIK